MKRKSPKVPSSQLDRASSGKTGSAIQHYFGEVSHKLLDKLWTAPRRLVLATGGGDVYSMLAAIDYLEANPVDILVTGQCMSAGVPILACGRARIATPQTRFMVHPASLNLGTSQLQELRSEARELETIEDLYCQALARHTARDSRWWAEHSASPYFFDAKEAKKIGLIDEIV